MSDIQNININKFELKLTDTDDPVAQKVSWEPAKSGGANFKTQKIEISAEKVVVKKTLGMILFGLVFFLPGLGGLLIGAPYNFINGDEGAGFFFILWGAGFGGAGLAMLYFTKPFTIDKMRGVFYRGKKYNSNPTGKKKTQGLLVEIHAIQLLSERVQSKNNNYTSYELNLVFKDGNRMNIMDHGNGKDIEEAAKKLGQMLKVPIWQASY